MKTILILSIFYSFSLLTNAQENEVWKRSLWAFDRGDYIETAYPRPEKVKSPSSVCPYLRISANARPKNISVTYYSVKEEFGDFKKGDLLFYEYLQFMPDGRLELYYRHGEGYWDLTLDRYEEFYYNDKKQLIEMLSWKKGINYGIWKESLCEKYEYKYYDTGLLQKVDVYNNFITEPKHTFTFKRTNKTNVNYVDEMYDEKGLMRRFEIANKRIVRKNNISDNTIRSDVQFFYNNFGLLTTIKRNTPDLFGRKENTIFKYNQIGDRTEAWEGTKQIVFYSTERDSKGRVKNILYTGRYSGKVFIEVQYDLGNKHPIPIPNSSTIKID